VTQKWTKDIRPAIESSRYRHLLPREGPGSKGGRPSLIQFGNGVTLSFMTGGGSDKKRAGETSRVLVITEVDGMDLIGGTSRETDKISQLEARVRAFKDPRIYGECTVSIEAGRTWQEYSNGTASRLVLPCPACRAFVSPEREHLVGWQDAPDVLAARDGARVVCPACGSLWTEEQRVAANNAARLLHRGQEIDPQGVIHGAAPRTDTLGFRWNTLNNCLVPMAEAAGDEWKAVRATDQDAAERKLLQFVWARPYKPDTEDLSSLSAEAIAKRTTELDKGEVPKAAVRIVTAVDCGKRLCHWATLAMLPDGTPIAIDYGRQEVPWEELGEEEGLRLALRTLRDEVFRVGWGGRRPSAVWVDSGYLSTVVYEFCRESGPEYLPSKGYGVNQRDNGRYKPVKQTGSSVAYVGEQYHIARLRKQKTRLAEINADHWKAWVHHRLSTPAGQSGGMLLFDAPSSQHMSLAKHLTAEVPVEVFAPGKGTYHGWRVVDRNNHWFDALALCGAAANYCEAKQITAGMGAGAGGETGREEKQGRRAGSWGSWKSRQ
jgi:phage terminase large subunit GpA-like protein